MQGWLYDFDHFAVHDGKGIRTNVYFLGCSLRCKWCQSPESQPARPHLIRVPSRCIGCKACRNRCPTGLTPSPQDQFEQEKCKSCGVCTKFCPVGAIWICGKQWSLEDALEEAAKDNVFFSNSGGGVTLTGGEVLMQPEFAIGMAKGLFKRGIDVLVETSGYGSFETLKTLACYVSFYFDVKGRNDERHTQNTGHSNQVIKINLQSLRKITDKITLRVPLIPGINDSDEDLKRVYALANKLSLPVQLLPYNVSAAAKYEWIKKPYLLGQLSTQSTERLCELVALAPKNVSVIVNK